MYQQLCANLPMPKLLLLYDQMIFKALQRLLIEFDFPRDEVVQHLNLLTPQTLAHPPTSSYPECPVLPHQYPGLCADWWLQASPALSEDLLLRYAGVFSQPLHHQVLQLSGSLRLPHRCVEVGGGGVPVAGWVVVVTNFNVSSRQGFKLWGLSPWGPSLAHPCLTLAWASQQP